MRKNLLNLASIMLLPTIVAAGPFDDLASVEVIPGWRATSGEHIAALRITLEPGWKTYWRSPGDGGIPPRFSFAGSENVRAVAPHFPVPKVFDQNGLRSVGYEDNFVLPLSIYTDNPDDPIQISGQLEIGVCEEVCIPVTLDFSERLPITQDRNPSIAAAMIDRPLSAAEAGVGDVICAVQPIHDGLRVTATMDVASTGGAEFVVIETENAQVWVSEADVTRSGNQLQATVDMVHMSGAAFALDRSTIRITILGQNQAVDIQGCSGG